MTSTGRKEASAPVGPVYLFKLLTEDCEGESRIQCSLFIRPCALHVFSAAGRVCVLSQPVLPFPIETLSQNNLAACER